MLLPLPVTASVLGPAVWYFGDFVLDLPCFELRRNGRSVRVEPQVFDVLTQLVKHHRRVVTKNELFDAVWGGRFVGEAALTSRIKAVRRALGDDGESQHYIRTVRGRGYRFVGVLIDPEADQAVDTTDADDWGSEMMLNLANPAGADRVSAPRPSTITRSRPNTRPRGTVDAA